MASCRHSKHFHVYCKQKYCFEKEINLLWSKNTSFSALLGLKRAESERQRKQQDRTRTASPSPQHTAAPPSAALWAAFKNFL